MPTDKFQFLGFYPKTKKDKGNFYSELNRKNITSIFFESSHRILQTLEDIFLIYPTSELVVAKELTKIHEKFLRGTPEKIINEFKLDKNLKELKRIVLEKNFNNFIKPKTFNKKSNEIKQSLNLKEIESFIKKSYKDNIHKLIIVTGKGLHSKNDQDPYVSKDLGILKYSIPDFLKNNSELTKMISNISDATIKDGGTGGFYIF